MQQSHQLIAILHSTNPRIPRSILKSVSIADQDEDNRNDGVRRCHASDGIADDLESWGGDGDTELPKVHVNAVDGEGGEGVAGEWGKEDAGDDGV